MVSGYWSYLILGPPIFLEHAFNVSLNWEILMSKNLFCQATTLLEQDLVIGSLPSLCDVSYC